MIVIRCPDAIALWLAAGYQVVGVVRGRGMMPTWRNAGKAQVVAWEGEKWVELRAE